MIITVINDYVNYSNLPRLTMTSLSSKQFVNINRK